MMKVYGNKVAGIMLVNSAVIGMDGHLVILSGPLLPHLMELDVLSWISEIVLLIIMLKLPWMELLLQQHRQTLLA